MIKPSIIDPHGHHLPDAVVKLVGLVEYAEAFGSVYHRIDAIADVKGVMTVLDLLDATVRAGVKDSVTAGKSALELYQDFGKKYA